MRSDTERLDWLEKNTKVLRRPDDGGLPYCDTVRDSFDAAMAAEEGKELEEAWKWFREGEFSISRWFTTHCHYIWQVSGAAGEVKLSEGESRHSAILAAYRASKGS